VADPDHLKMLQQGVYAWNAWRKEKPDITPNLSRADLRQVDLCRADLTGADLRGARLDAAKLRDANLCGADLTEAQLNETDLCGADLREAHLSNAPLMGADLSDADLGGADLSPSILYEAILIDANLSGVNLSSALLNGANLSDANLSKALFTGADLSDANLRRANLSRAILSDANLSGTSLVDVDITNADLTGCRVYGVSAWGLKLNGETKQQNLIITAKDEADIKVDDIEVSQFVYLLLNNAKIRHVIDTITSKVVLILGRFTGERKAVLDALRDELRKRDYVPILFDFEKSTRRNTDETITLFARMARFVIADISDAKSVLQELRGIVPDLSSVPVQPVIIASQEEPGMFDFYRTYPWFLPVHRYDTPAQLLSELTDRVIKPSEDKVLEIRGPYQPR
jgi:uncharacterized protein YjbI with pentapeptide repeats